MPIGKIMNVEMSIKNSSIHMRIQTPMCPQVNANNHTSEMTAQMKNMHTGKWLMSQAIPHFDI